MLCHFCVFLCMFLLSSPPAAEFFVGPAGNDRNPGTREKPFLTLERARDAARALRTAGGATADGITVRLTDGTYELDRTFELGPEDSGTEAAPFVISGLPGGRVRISGARIVPGRRFGPVRDETALRRLPAQGRGHVVSADLRSLGITDYGRHRQFGHGHPVVPAPLELFWNDIPLPLARYPNTGAILMGSVVEPGSVPRDGDYSERGGRFAYTDSRHSRWAGVPDVWLQGYFHHGFSDDKIRIASIDTVRREITFATPHMYGLGSGENFNLYVALNLLEELDEPGEWYVDRDSGVLFLWPPGDHVSARIAVSVVDQPLIVMENCSYIVLRGLTIEGGRALGVYMQG
jgi:hypothetical protein